MTDADQPIDLMSATLEEIQTLHGFGEKTAEKNHRHATSDGNTEYPIPVNHGGISDNCSS